MRSSLRFLALLTIFVLAGYLLFQVRHVFLPFILAAAASYLLHPLPRFFEVRGLKHTPIVVTVYVVLMALYLGGAYLIVLLATREAAHVATDLPLYMRRIRELLTTDTQLQNRFPMLAHLPLDEWLHSHLQSSQSAGVSRIMTLTPVLAAHLFPVLELLLLVPFLTLFFMLDGVHVKEAVLELVPVKYLETTLHLLARMDTSLGNYVRGLLLQAFALGIAAGIGYGAMGLHYYLQIGLWVGLTSMIPLIGPISAALAGGLVALFQWGTVAGLIKVLIVCLGIRLLDDWFLHPFILRRAVHIHPAFTVFALMAGATLGGFWGAIFAVPLACTLKVICEVLWEWIRSEYHLAPPSLQEENSHVPLL